MAENDSLEDIIKVITPEVLAILKDKGLTADEVKIRNHLNSRLEKEHREDGKYTGLKYVGMQPRSIKKVCLLIPEYLLKSEAGGKIGLHLHTDYVQKLDLTDEERKYIREGTTVKPGREGYIFVFEEEEIRPEVFPTYIKSFMEARLSEGEDHVSGISPLPDLDSYYGSERKAPGQTSVSSADQAANQRLIDGNLDKEDVIAGENTSLGLAETEDAPVYGDDGSTTGKYEPMDVGGGVIVEGLDLVMAIQADNDGVFEEDPRDSELTSAEMRNLEEISQEPTPLSETKVRLKGRLVDTSFPDYRSSQFNVYHVGENGHGKPLATLINQAAAVQIREVSLYPPLKTFFYREGEEVHVLHKEKKGKRLDQRLQDYLDYVKAKFPKVYPRINQEFVNRLCAMASEKYQLEVAEEAATERDHLTRRANQERAKGLLTIPGQKYDTAQPEPLPPEKSEERSSPDTDQVPPAPVPVVQRPVEKPTLPIDDKPSIWRRKLPRWVGYTIGTIGVLVGGFTGVSLYLAASSNEPNNTPRLPVVITIPSLAQPVVPDAGVVDAGVKPTYELAEQVNALRGMDMEGVPRDVAGMRKALLAGINDAGEFTNSDPFFDYVQANCQRIAGIGSFYLDEISAENALQEVILTMTGGLENLTQQQKDIASYGVPLLQDHITVPLHITCR
jgi:hypothetical protein